MLHQELGHQEPYLLNKQRQSPEGPDVAHNIEDENADRRVSAVLSQALNQRKQLVLLHRQRYRFFV